MRKISLAALCLFAAVPSSWATAVGGSVEFDSQPLGIFGTWTVNFNTADPAIKLTSVNINFGASGFFIDTTFAAPGALLPFDFTQVSGGAATGFSSISPAAGAPLNGATAFTLNFNDFGNGESFSFILDADQCAAQSFDCSTVTGAELGQAGVVATFTFGGPGYGSYTRTATFVNRTSANNEFDAVADFSADVPEPSTWVMIGTALAGLGLRRRKHHA
jgi:hypothetical protein